jgi:hypothetical protein
MLSYTASFNSFYTVSKGIRRKTLLNSSKIKLLLPVNLLKVNKTYFTTDSNNVSDIFLSHFNLQQKKEIEKKRRILYQASICRNTDIKTVKLSLNSFCNDAIITTYTIDKLNSYDSIKISQLYRNLIFYFFVMDEEFFLKAFVRQYTRDTLFLNNHNIDELNSRDFEGVTAYEDNTITSVNHVGFYLIATNEELKKEDFHILKISLKI